ncbi:MAG: hypothetical protein AAGB22_00465, partial [Bacteroidota bacterium]
GNELGYCLTVGWDIRPNRIQWFLLRTNLRYFPRIRLDLGGDLTYRFDAFEFNFIQFICFPDRLF